MIQPSDIPFLPRGVRCQFDRVRGVEVLLGPERVLMLDDIGKAVLGRVDGASSIDTIADGLAKDYDAPKAQILDDVLAYLGDLFDKRLVERTHG